MPVTAGVIMGGAGLAGSLVGGSKSSKGAQAAGQAEAGVAEQGLQYAEQSRNQAYAIASSAAIPSPQELNLMDQTVGNSMQALQAQSSAINSGLNTLNSLAPSIVASGNQTTALLQGQSAAILAPIQANAARQRVQLQNQLASTMGPGYATTAAGIMALNNFDNNTTMTMANAQLQAFNQSVSATTSLAGTANSLMQGVSGQTNSLTGLASGMQTTQQQLQMQSANTLLGGSAQAIGASNTLAGTIGNQYAGQISQGQNIAGLGGAVGQSGMTMGMMSALSTPSTPSTLSSYLTPSQQDALNSPSPLTMPASSPMMAGGGYSLGGFNFSGSTP
jgi:hypothetical protein